MNSGIVTDLQSSGGLGALNGFPDLHTAKAKAFKAYPEAMRQFTQSRFDSLPFIFGIYCIALGDGNPLVIDAAHRQVNDCLNNLPPENLKDLSLNSGHLPSDLQHLIITVMNCGHQSQQGQYRTGCSKHGKRGGIAYRMG